MDTSGLPKGTSEIVAAPAVAVTLRYAPLDPHVRRELRYISIKRFTLPLQKEGAWHGH